VAACARAGKSAMAFGIEPDRAGFPQIARHRYGLRPKGAKLAISAAPLRKPRAARGNSKSAPNSTPSMPVFQGPGNARARARQQQRPWELDLGTLCAAGTLSRQVARLFLRSGNSGLFRGRRHRFPAARRRARPTARAGVHVWTSARVVVVSSLRAAAPGRSRLGPQVFRPSASVRSRVCPLIGAFPALLEDGVASA
jgi:hypothetical protein